MRGSRLHLPAKALIHDRLESNALNETDYQVLIRPPVVGAFIYIAGLWLGNHGGIGQTELIVHTGLEKPGGAEVGQERCAGRQSLTTIGQSQTPGSVHVHEKSVTMIQTSPSHWWQRFVHRVPGFSSQGCF